MDSAASGVSSEALCAFSMYYSVLSNGGTGTIRQHACIGLQLDASLLNGYYQQWIGLV